LRSKVGTTFQYKPNTSSAASVRTHGRNLQIELSSEVYVKYLQQTPLELDALFRDPLDRCVDQFLRDPAAFWR
jgi:hypothetical protein